MEKRADETSRNRGDNPSQAMEKDEHYYRPLLRAAYNGDWDTAARFFEKDPDAKTAMLTSKSETALHIASMTSHDGFVEKLVNEMTPESLAMVDGPRTRTALHYAAMGERLRMMKALVRKNFTLTQLPDKDGNTPLHLIVVFGQKNRDALWFLVKATTNDPPAKPFTGTSAATLILNLAYMDFPEVLLDVVTKYPDLLIIENEQKKTVVSRLARSPSCFLSGGSLNALERLISKWIPVDMDIRIRGGANTSDRRIRDSFWEAAETLVPPLRKIRDVKVKHDCACELVRRTCESISQRKMREIIDFFLEDETIVQAASFGTVELIEICLQYYPELICCTMNGTNILSNAITFRQAKVLRFFSERNALHKQAFLYEAPDKGNEDVKEERKNLLWDVVESSSKYKSLSVSGAAFHMQSEVQWFKAVEDFVVTVDMKYLRNNVTPWVNFMTKKEVLREKGEKWMKGTSKSCMLVAALIATVVFAGAFTVPGGNKDNVGTPVLLGQKPFMIFSITNALALFSSVTAILMFLSILTSRYDLIDFLKSLPQKFIIGLASLVLSLAFMLASFGTALSILMDDKSRWIVIPIVLLSSIPILLFVTLQLPLFFTMVKSTCCPEVFHG